MTGVVPSCPESLLDVQVKDEFVALELIRGGRRELRAPRCVVGGERTSAQEELFVVGGDRWGVERQATIAL